MAAVVTALCLLAFLLGYRFYARFIGRRIYDDREEIVTPAHELRDERDYVPTNKHILFGHHFTSIAGAAPIIGPCVAVYWGWLPALLWIVLGVVFMGAVHDFGALVVSAREKGRSIADIAGRVITPRVRVMFLCFVMVLNWLVLAVFAMVIARMFAATPSSVLPINVEIIVATVIGWLIYKKGIGATLPSIVALGILYFFVWYGVDHPVDMVALGWAKDQGSARSMWCIFLFAYSAVASLLPVWLLLQPRDYINSHQLMVGLGLLFTGLFVTAPSFDAPMMRDSGTDGGGQGWFPLLFVTIACGAISGFHGLVSSGTTSKQLNRMGDARMIGYGGMLGEGCLALAAVMAAAAGLAYVGACDLDGRAIANLGYGSYYTDFKNAGALGPRAFVLGGGAFLQELGVGKGLAETLMAVLVISFAATTLDTATRIQRFIVQEIGQSARLRPLTNPYLATVIALVPAVMMVFWQVEVPDPAAGPGAVKTTEAAWILWPVFGASNQMLAALTLLVLSMYFWMRKRPVLPLVIPMVLITAVSFYALVERTSAFLGQGNWLMVAINGVLLALLTWMMVEGVVCWRQLRERVAG